MYVCLREPLEVRLEYYDVPPKLEYEYLGNNAASFKTVGYTYKVNMKIL